jgi:hypothetical protein
MSRSQFIAFVDLAAGRAPAISFPAIPGGQPVLGVQAWDGWGLLGEGATRTGRHQTGEHEAVQQRAGPSRPPSAYAGGAWAAPGGQRRRSTAHLTGKVTVAWGLHMGSMAHRRGVVEVEDTLSL